MKKTILIVLALVVVVAAVIVLVSRPGPEKPVPVEKPPTGLAALPPAAEETGTAADFVPADCAFFSTMLRLGEQYDLIAESNALTALLELPFVEAQLAQLRASPQYQQFVSFLETDPRGQAGLAVAKDALSQELFAFGGKDCIAVLQNLNELNTTMQVAPLRAMLSGGMGPGTPGPDPMVFLLPEVLARADELYVPPVVLGFKIDESKEQLVGLLEELRQAVNAEPQAPVKIEKVTIGEGEYYTMHLSAGQLIPPAILQDMVQNLQRGGVSGQQAHEFLRWLTGQTAALTVGFFRSYAIVSVGRDNEHLRRLGSGPAIGTSDELAPARRFVDKRLLSIGYVSKELTGLGGFQPENLKGLLEMVLAEAPPGALPEGMAERLRGDVDELSADLAAAVPPPSERVSVAFLNRGVESYTFVRGTPFGLDCSQPLSILEYVGGTPIFVFATRSRSSRPAYETAVNWGKRFYAYVDEYLVPTLSPSDRQEFDEFESVVIPFLRSVDRTTRESLLPAIDAGQSLLVLDGEMRLEQFFLGRPFPQVMPMVEPAIAVELKDSQAFLRAMGEYVAAVDEMVQGLQAIEGTGLPPGPFRVPRPTSIPFTNGRMYFYQLPQPLDESIMLHAVVTDNLLVLSASPAQTERMVVGGASLRDPVVDIHRAAGTVMQFRTEELWECAQAWVDFALATEQGPLARTDPASREAIGEQVAVLWKVIGTFKGATSRTYADEAYVVTHTWFEFQDITGEQ